MSEAENDINPRLDSLIDDWAERIGVGRDQLVTQLDRAHGLDVTDVSDDDAEKFVDAVEQQDWDDAGEVLRENGVSESDVDEFVHVVKSMSAGNSNGPSSGESSGGESDNGKVPDARENGHSSGSDLSRDDVQQMINESVPDADDIAGSLQRQMGGGGGGGGGQEAAGGGGGGTLSGMDSGTQQVLAQALAQKFLGGGGGGAAAQLGEEVQNEAMKGFIRDLRKPDLGDLLEMKYYKKVLGDDEVEAMMADYMPGDDRDDDSSESDPFEALFVEEPDDDADDDSGGGWW